MLELMEEIVSLPASYPRLRPAGTALAAWLDRVVTRELEPSIDEALGLIEEPERVRLVDGYALAAPVEWKQLTHELGDAALAQEALLAGGVIAALRERWGPDPDALELVEELADVRADPAQALGFALEGADLWSFDESVAADAALAALPEHLDDDAYDVRWKRVLAEQAELQWSDWHEERLELLVARLRARLPLDGFPVASRALAGACERFDGDPAFRRELAAVLLSDTLSRVFFAGVHQRLAA